MSKKGYNDILVIKELDGYTPTKKPLSGLDEFLAEYLKKQGYSHPYLIFFSIVDYDESKGRVTFSYPDGSNYVISKKDEELYKATSERMASILPNIEVTALVKEKAKCIFEFAF